LRAIRALYQSAIAAHGTGEDVAAVGTSFGADRM
jgi:hypothetical protein